MLLQVQFMEIIKIKKLVVKKIEPIINLLSFYALTKEINEKFAKIFTDKNFRCFGLRFFSVYGDIW